MGQVAGKATSKKIVDQAKAYRTDSVPINHIRTTLREIGSMVTYRPAKGNMSNDRHVYAGDLSAEETATVLQIRPLITLEYNRSTHSATVKHGVTGDVLMMLVRELSDDPWFAEGNMRCACGGQTEARLYANGRPVAVVMGKYFLDVAPSPQVNGEERTQLGASMIELMRVQQGSSLSFYRRKKDNTKGSQIGIYTKIRNHAAVFKLTAEDVVDPLVLIAMGWFASIEKS